MLVKTTQNFLHLDLVSLVSSLCRRCVGKTPLLWLCFCLAAGEMASIGVSAVAFAAKAPEPEEQADKPDPNSFKPTNGYVHQWNRLPEISGTDLLTRKRVRFGRRPGVVSVPVFIASWCTLCRKIIEDVKKLAEVYPKSFFEIIYVFAHDTQRDALAFAKEYQLEPAVLADMALLQDYHNPDLPTLYLGDRRGWMAKRCERCKAEGLKDFERSVRLLTAL